MGSTILQLGTLTPWHEHARSRRHDRAVNERVCDDADVAQVGDDEAKLILARGSGAHVIASAPQRQYDDVIVDYRVEVTAQGLSANTIVTSLGGDDLAGFLDGLAEHFTGWPGTRSWRSLEDQLRVEAEWGSRGHVTLLIRLRPRAYDPPWDLAITTVVEAGAEMQTLAREVASFFGM
jgi:hypothetical protein